MAPRTVMATFVGVLVAFVAAAVALSDRSPGWGMIAWAGAGLVAVAAIVVGVVRHRPSLPWPWLLLAGSILVSTGADVLYLRWEAGDQSNVGLANALYLATFVIAAAAVLRFCRSASRGPEQTGLFSALALTLILLLLTWVIAISPGGYSAWSMTDPALVAYPIGDALLLAAAFRLVVARRRSTAGLLLVAGALIALVADVTNGLITAPVSAPIWNVLDACWLVFYGCWGAAALHPSMTRLTAPEVLAERELTARRLATVSISALVPPVILLVEAARGHIRDGVILGLASIVLFVFSLARVTAMANGHRRSLVYRERHDTLTGLANRATLVNRLEAALADADQRPVAVMLVDLDHFGAINDRVGHSVGDEVLAAVARRLVSHLGRHDVVARVGGDAFAVLVELSAGRNVAALMSRIAAVTSEPVTAAGRSIPVTACVGLTIVDTQPAELPGKSTCDDGPPSATEVLRQADLAVRAAREVGPGQTCQYSSEQHGRIVERMRLREALQQAVDESSFQLLYQPIVVLATSDTVGFEALVRWEHPTRGLVGPSEFIALAEETGLIEPIGDLVLRTAIADAVAWSQVSSSPAYVSVNVSARQFRNPGFSERVEQIVAAAGLPPSQLTLEITESVLMREDDHVWGELATLRANGIRLAIDDFGTGYSSLSYLEQTPIDIIKIDKSFVGTLVDSSRQHTVVEGIMQMAEKLGLEIVAEGVENPAQRDLLVEMRCPYGQGYLYAVPLTRAEATNWLAYPPARSIPASAPPAPPIVPPPRTTVERDSGDRGEETVVRQ